MRAYAKKEEKGGGNKTSVWKEQGKVVRLPGSTAGNFVVLGGGHCRYVRGTYSEKDKGDYGGSRTMEGESQHIVAYERLN